MDTVNTIEPSQSGIEVSFSWTPVVTYTINSINYPAANPNTQLTFTANAGIYSSNNDFQGPLSIIEYFWDFGDGISGYGNTIMHTYSQPYLNAQTVLRVTDSRGRRWFGRAQMYVIPSTGGGVGSLPLVFTH